MRDVVATDNHGGSAGTVRNDYKFDDCATNSAGASRCVRNRSIGGEITRATEEPVFDAWQDKVRRAAVKIGPR
jgi:hypothetical protein